MSKIPLFYNPNARSSKLKRINNWINLHRDSLDILESKSPEHMFELVKNAACQEKPVVAVAGGDGTLSMAAKALLGSQTALAVIPSGTVNVFARELDIFNPSFSKSWRAIEQGNVREVDIFLANGTPFVQMCGIGLDSRAIEFTTAEMKRKWAWLAYVLGGLKALRGRQPRLTITTEQGERYEGFTAIFGNGAKYGGPMNVFGHADNGDGLLDMILFTGGPAALLKDCSLAALRGGFDDEMQGDFEYIRLTGCSIESDIPASYELDGDLGDYSPLTISKSPFTLKVVALPR